MHFTKKLNNVKVFVNLHIRPIQLFCRQYFLQEVFVRFHFLAKISRGKVSINFIGDKGFHILLLLSDCMLFKIEQILSMGADVPSVRPVA